MNVIIPAAGDGTRMGKTGKTPKCLMRVGRESVLERTIRICNEAGIKNITIVTGYKTQMVEGHAKSISPNISAVYNKHWEWTNNVYSMWLARDYMDDDFLIINSDLVFDSVALSSMIESKHDYSILINGPISLNEVENYDIKIYRNASNKTIEYIGKEPYPGNTEGMEVFEEGDMVKVSYDFADTFVEHMADALLEEDIAFNKFKLENYMVANAEKLHLVNTNGFCKEFDTEEEYKKIAKKFQR